MQAFLAILRYDLGLLTRSWITHLWLPLLIAPALFLVAVAANQDELASETLGAYLAAVLIPISGLAVAVLTTAAVSGESGIIADGILSRSVTRSEYMAAKIVSRLGFTAAVYALVMIPFSYLILRYAAPDTSLAGVVVGLLIVGLLLMFLGALGITFSTIFSNMLFAILVVLLIVIVFQGVVLQFLGLPWMSPTAVVLGLPGTFRGQTPTWDLVRIVLVFSALTAAAIATSFWVFRERDL
ncbi:MAG: hypothetical protein O2822_00670 [Chloroflexi bacterium]|nr:hypothetical protein [Chloroflexota bacterium]